MEYICKIKGCKNPVRGGGKTGKCDACHNTLYRYNLTDLQRKEILKDQGSGCAICGIDIKFNGMCPPNMHSAVVDHDDTLDKKNYRGILCNNCNRGIGFLQHDKDVLENAIYYLENTVPIITE